MRGITRVLGDTVAPAEASELTRFEGGLAALIARWVREGEATMLCERLENWSWTASAEPATARSGLDGAYRAAAVQTGLEPGLSRTGPDRWVVEFEREPVDQVLLAAGISIPAAVIEDDADDEGAHPRIEGQHEVGVGALTYALTREDATRTAIEALAGSDLVESAEWARAARAVRDARATAVDG
ncbi:MAG: hypothetical protein WCJ30_06015 [Deltaproteobacteria bacterium]